MSSGRRIEEEPIEKKIARILKYKNLSVTVAESCTGGLVAGTLVNADGISEVFKEGFVTYSNDAKIRLLEVSEDTLNTYGAVSRQTAKEMAEGAAKQACAEAAVSTTGIAGPDGGTKDKPVGLVFVGCTLKGHTVVKRCFFGGDRQTIRYRAVREALSLLYCQLLADDSEKPVTEDEE